MTCVGLEGQGFFLFQNINPIRIGNQVMNLRNINSLAVGTRFSFLVVVAATCIGLTGCASVDVTPLNKDFTEAKGQAKGLYYYMPKPYLLVMELPAVNSSATSDKVGSNTVIHVEPSGDPLGTEDANSPGGGGGGGGENQQSTNTAQSTLNGANAPVSDTSFAATTAQYTVKLIYLPDYDHPMAMTETTGLFGTAEMKPVLQDGWMLTSLDASTDNGTSAALAALAGLPAQILSSASSTAQKGAAAGVGSAPRVSNVLAPGLYSIGGSDGLKVVVLFKNGVITH